MNSKLKRLTAIFLSITFIIAGIPFAEAVEPNCSAAVSFSSDCSDIQVGETENIVFSATLSCIAPNSSLSVRDENGKVLAKMRSVGDCKYSAEIAYSTDTAGDNSFRLFIDNKPAAESSFTSYEKLDEYDVTQNDTTWKNISNAIVFGKQKSKSSQEILSDCFSILKADEAVKKVWYADSEMLNFESFSGIENVLSAEDIETYSAVNYIADEVDFSETVEQLSYSSPKANNMNQESLNSPTCKDIGVYGPYYGVEDDFTLSYKLLGDKIAKTTQGEVIAHFGDGSHDYPAANVQSFQHWERFGIAMVDSHGSYYDGESCICVDTPGEYAADDLSAGHLVRGVDFIGVKGTYITKYSEKLPNTIVYLGSCFGLAARNICDPLLELGASIVFGYDNTVSFQYEKRIFDATMRQMVTTKSDTNAFYCAHEAWEYSTNKYGKSDPYGSSGAKFIYYGNASARVLEIKQLVYADISSTSVILKPDSDFSLSVRSFPKDAVGYSVSYSIADETVATISDEGELNALKIGETEVTCTIVDSSVYPTLEYINTCKVRVSDEEFYTVTFIDYDETTIAENHLLSGESCTLPKDPFRNEHLFIGWEGNWENVTQNETVKSNYAMYGDANMDGKINTGDATFILSCIVGKVTPTQQQKLLCDANGDGAENTGDAMYILKKIADG